MNFYSGSRYETTDFEGQMMAMYDQMKPLYRELHAYIRWVQVHLTWIEAWIDLNECKILDLSLHEAYIVVKAKVA